MDASTIRFIALLLALCVLVGLNTAASVLHVPLGDRAAADVTGAITALGGLLIGDRLGSRNPPT
jgi:hypothetical protein